MPDREFMNAVMQKYLGEVDNFAYDEKGAGFGVKKFMDSIITG